MPEYKVVLARSARKELDRLPLKFAERIFDRIQDLERSPRPVGCLKLKDELGRWRIRIGDYRVIYEIDDAGRMIDVLYIRHRKDVYRDI